MDIDEPVRLLLTWSRPDVAKFSLKHTQFEAPGTKENWI